MTFRPCCLLLIAMLCACSNGDDDLIGEWRTPEFAGSSSWITFSSDRTAVAQSDRNRAIRMNWKRLDHERFTLTQADGVAWAGCLSEGVINIRMRPERNGRDRIYLYRRSGRDGWSIFRKRSSASLRPTCTP